MSQRIPSFPRRAGLAAGLGALVVLLAACELRTDLVVREDGSGTFAVELAIEQQLFRAEKGSDRGLAETAVLAEILRAVPPGWSVRRTSDERFQRVHASVPFESLDRLRTELAALAQAELPPPGIDDITVVRTTGGWRFRLARGTSEDEPPADLTAVVSVTLPGRDRTSNASSVRHSGERTVFTWISAPDAELLPELTAETEEIAGAAPFPVAAVVGAVLVVAGALLLARMRRARRRGGHGTAGGMPEAGGEVAGDWYEHAKRLVVGHDGATAGPHQTWRPVAAAATAAGVGALLWRLVRRGGESPKR